MTDHDRAWTPWRRHYVLAVLCLIGMFSMIDRQIMSILLQPIKEEFGASDTVMGLLVSTVFAGFYITAAIPIARLSDRHSRRIVVALCLAAWSAATSLGAVAGGVVSLALTRIGVAVAEAGAGPASTTMIADLYPMRSRGLAFGVSAASAAVGAGLAVFLGGWLSDAFSWRTSFALVGLPGILLAGWFLLTVREPPRGLSDAVRDTGETPTLAETFACLWRMKTYRYLVLTLALAAFCGYGTLTWGPTFLRRIHHMSGAQVGLWFGLVTAGSLIVGNVGGGMLADRLGKHDLRAYLWIASVGPLLSFPAGLLFAAAKTPALALTGYFFFLMPLTFHIPTTGAMIQALAPLRMRATASVLSGLAQTLMGLFLAPLVMGALNDTLAPRFGEASIRYAIGIAVSTAVLASGAAFLGSLWLRADHARAQGDRTRQGGLPDPMAQVELG